MPTFCPKGSAVATRSSWELAPILRTRGPRRRAQVQTLQFLNHGGTLDYTYWDFAPNYSYVDAAAAAGYATFNYDRLGYGLSDHLLASGTRRARRYLPVTVALVGKYSADLDALIFTGILISIEPVGIAQIAFNLISASLDPSGRFNELDKGYLTQGAVAQDLLFPFHRYPDFDTKSRSPKKTSLRTQLLCIQSISQAVRHSTIHRLRCAALFQQPYRAAARLHWARGRRPGPTRLHSLPG